ncbi:MAG: hypothetical protein ACK5LN_00920, partial [Propioniciclava sp.]
DLTTDWDLVSRRGWLTWLRDAMPLPLDPGLLDLELGVLSAQLPLADLDAIDRWLDPAREAMVLGLAERLIKDNALPLWRNLARLALDALAELPAGQGGALRLRRCWAAIPPLPSVSLHPRYHCHR